MTAPVTEQLRNLEFLLRNGATYDLYPGLGSDVLDRIDTFLARFIAYPDVHARHAHVLWIAHTYFMDVWEATPRLLLLSPEAGSGKTRALTVTSHLVPHADHTGDLTPAYLFHSIDESLKNHGTRPTLLYDELDTVFGPVGGHAQMRRLIDIGHDKNASVSRQIRGEATHFPIYAAMALAGKMHVHDVPSTIRTRSVIILLQRRAAHEKVERWSRRTSPAEATPLRELLQLWAEFVHAHAHEYLPDIPEGIEDRDADLWEPLLSVADLAGGRWPEIACVTGVTLVTASGVKAEPSPGIQLLWDIRDVFDKQRGNHELALFPLGHPDRIFTAGLLTGLKNLEESRWAALTPLRMAQILKSYGVEPELQRIGERVARGYRREYFTDAWSRYPKRVTPVTPVTDLSDE